jgi:hypothetical protein
MAEKRMGWGWWLGRLWASAKGGWVRERGVDGLGE